MTTETNGTALATRDLSDTQLKTRMDANIKARFGLHEATPAQLNVIYLVARKWQLDPINEITLYEGRPFITLDGRLQLMRRHPDYCGYRTRPLNRSEREDWGYEPDDAVVECTVVTRTHGEITARGCVRRTEIDAARGRAKDSGKRAAPVGIFGPEIAEKRAIARASRAAFGQDVPDEDDAQIVIQEQRDPERIKALAAQYDRVMGSDDDKGVMYYDQAGPAAVAEVAPVEEPPVEDDQTMTRETWNEVSAEADRLNIPHKKLPSGAGPDMIEKWTVALMDRINEATVTSDSAA